MGNIQHGGTLPDSAQKSDFYSIIDNGSVSGIVNADIASNAGISVSKISGAAASGANADITSLSGLTTPLSAVQGGTGSNLSAAAQGAIPYFSATGVESALDPGTLGQALISQGAAANPIWGNPPYIKCSNVQTSGTGGGTGTQGSWTTVTLNTKDNDTGSIATLSSNQISIPAGTYKVRSSCPLYTPNGNGIHCQSRIYNITDSAVLVTGQSSSVYNTGTSSGDGSLHTDNSFVDGLFTISGTKTIALQYYVGANFTSDASNLGKAATTGSNEVYAQIVLEKIA